MFTPRNAKPKHKQKPGKLTKSGRIYKNDLLDTDMTANFRPTRRLV